MRYIVISPLVSPGSILCPSDPPPGDQGAYCYPGPVLRCLHGSGSLCLFPHHKGSYFYHVDLHFIILFSCLDLLPPEILSYPSHGHVVRQEYSGGHGVPAKSLGVRQLGMLEKDANPAP